MLLFYVYRSLIARLRSNALTTLAILLFVVGSTVGFTVYANLVGRLVDATPPELVIVLTEGAVSEENSKLERETAHKIALLDGVKQQGRDRLAALELVATVDVNTTDFTHYYEPASFRGTDEQSLAVHGVRVVRGTAPAPGSLQLMVGARLARRHSNLAVGSDLALPGGPSRISGEFEANGSAVEDELWTPRAALEIHLHQQYLSSMTLVADSAARVPELVAKINGSPDYKAQATSLRAFRESGAGLATILKTVLVLVVLLSVVAVSAIATTMNAAVAIRLPEIATMSAIGIRRGVLARMVLAESVLLAAFGALLGVGIGELVRRAIGTITIGAYPVELAASPLASLLGLGLGLAVGVIGAVAPVIQVKRFDLIQMLR